MTKLFKPLFFSLLVFQLSVSFAQVQLDATGSGNAFEVTYPAVIVSAPSGGIEFTFKANHSITGAATLNLNGTGARPILKNFNKPLVANDIITGQFVRVIYDNSAGGVWQMMSVPASSGDNLGNHTATTQILGTGGTPAAPSYSFSSNNVTGIYLVNTNILGISTNSALRMFFDGFGHKSLPAAANGYTINVAGAAAIGTYGNGNESASDAPVNGLVVSGNVGIGTSLPGQNLVVVGNTSVTGNSSITGMSVSTNARITALSNGVLSVNGAGNVVTTSIAPSPWEASGANAITFGGINVNRASPQIVVGDNVAPVNQKQLMLGYNTASNYAQIQSIEQGIGFRNLIMGEGAATNIGIGTNTPASKLSVTNGVSIGTYASVNAAPSNGMIVSGNVGIGTPSPVALLDITSSVASDTKVNISNTSTANNGIELRTNNGAGLQYIDFTSGSTSNAGNGTPDYTNRLISGATSIAFQRSPGTTSLSINNSTGNVMIGQSTPSERLTVEGNISASGTSFTQNLRINALNTAGSVLTVNGSGDVGMGSIAASQWVNLNANNIAYSGGTSISGVATTAGLNVRTGPQALIIQTFNTGTSGHGIIQNYTTGRYTGSTGVRNTTQWEVGLWQETTGSEANDTWSIGRGGIGTDFSVNRTRAT